MSVIKRSNQLNKCMDAAHADLKKAVKNYVSAIQPEVDKTTDFLYDYLKPFLIAVRSDRLKTYGQNLIAVLTPTLEISANDVAPKYALKTALTFHLFAFVKEPDWTDMVWIDGDCMLSQGTGSRATSNLEIAIKDIFSCGINIELSAPKKKRRKLIEALIKKHNMIERFCLISVPELPPKSLTD